MPGQVAAKQTPVPFAALPGGVSLQVFLLPAAEVVRPQHDEVLTVLSKGLDAQLHRPGGDGGDSLGVLLCCDLHASWRVKARCHPRRLLLQQLDGLPGVVHRGRRLLRLALLLPPPMLGGLCVAIIITTGAIGCAQVVM